ncbi:MAG TPA: hypothetical protein VME41_05250 [Stellaceae bacterium]|nr:hypothetical protein [Stellaceae bacterium]
MFLLYVRKDMIPELRVLVNTDHIVGAMPSGTGGDRTKLFMSTGESWEVAQPFSRAIAVLRDGAAPDS